MRQHKIVCSLTGANETQYLQDLQNKVNEYTAIYIERSICESGLSKQEQIFVLEELLNSLRSTT